MAGGRNVIIFAMLAVAGLAVRLMVPAGDFPSSNPLPFPDDPPYHLQRLAVLAAGEFEYPDGMYAVDPTIAWPYGDKCIWPWGFDFLLAATAPLEKVCGESCMVNAAGLIPPVLAMLTALLVLLAGLRAFPNATALLAAAFFIFMPAGVSYSQAGRVDHHVLEPLFLLLPLFLGGWGGRTGDDSRKGVAKPALGGLACGLSAAFFPAAPAMMFPLFLVGGAWIQTTRKTVAWSSGMALGVLASLAVSPFPGQWSFHSPSLWHMATTICLSSGLIAFAFARDRLRHESDAAVPAVRPAARSRFVRHVVPALAGIVSCAGAAAIAAIAFPACLDAFRDGITYTTSSRIASLSLEAASFADSPIRLMEMTGWLLPLSAAGIVALATGSSPVRTISQRDRVLLIVVTLGFVALGFLQRRFLFAATPFIAVSAALGIGAVPAWTARILPRVRQVPGPVIALLGVVAVMPSLNTDLGLQSLTPQDRAMYSAAVAVARDKSNKAPVPPDAGTDSVADLGLLAPWGYGHLFRWTAGTPVVCDNFFGIPGADAAIERCLKLHYSTDDQEIDALLDTLRIGFVVIAPPHPDQIRAETAILGLEQSEWVADDGRLKPMFSQSFLGRLGIWASGARAGEAGPFGMVLMGKYRQVVKDSGQIQAEVFVLKRVR